MKKVLTLIFAAALAAAMTGCAVNEKTPDNDSGSSLSDSKSENKNDSKSENKNDSKSESKNDSKSESKNDSKPESKDDSKSESKDDSKPESKDDSKPESKDDSKPESKDDSKPESNTDSAAESGSEKYNKTQAAIIEYINTDLLDLAETETKMITSYSSVSGTNYTSDQVMYNELINTTIPAAKQLNREALELANKITDPELLMVHKKYVEYSSGIVSAFGIMTAALEKQDIAMVTTANDKLTAANNTVMDYKADLLKLAEKYGVTLNI